MTFGLLTHHMIEVKLLIIFGRLGVYDNGEVVVAWSSGKIMAEHSM